MTGVENPDIFRTDIDIALLWKKHYVGISCKLAANEEKLDEARSEIMAETRAGLGRFALPILVRGGINRGIAVREAEKSLPREPMEIGLCLLDDPNTLSNLMEEALKAKQTTT